MFERLRRWLWPPEMDLELRATQVHKATDYGRDILINSPDGWEHDQRGFWWINGPGGGGPNAFGTPPPGAGWPLDATFTGIEALPAVLRCTSIICDTIAGLPWQVFKGYDQQPTPRWINDPQLLREDRRVFPVPIVPDPLSHVEFWTQWIVSALWFGDGLAYSPELDQAGAVKPPLILLEPEKISFRPSERYPSMPYSYWHSDLGELDSAKIIRLRGEPPYQNGQLGTGVLARFASDIGLAAAMRAYASSIFYNGVPAGYLKVNTPVNPTDEQMETLQDRWMSRHGGPAKKVAVLNATTEFVPLSISPVDSALSEAKVWSLRDIAMAFGLPAYVLGVPGDSSTYANVESRLIEMQTFTQLQWIRRIEAALDAQFPLGTETKINTAGLLRADTATRFTAYESALRAGWLTKDEVRAKEDLPPLTAEQIAQQQPQAAPGAAQGAEQLPAGPEQGPASSAALEPVQGAAGEGI